MSKKGFTLVELLIGVTISALLMTGVAAFVGSGIESAYRIKKDAVSAVSEPAFEDAFANLGEFSGDMVYSGAFSAPYASGFVMINEGLPVPLSIVALKSSTGACDAFGDTATDPGALLKLTILSGYLPADGIQNDGSYTASHTGHVVTGGGGVVVLGTGKAGSAGGSGSVATATELRFPSSVASVSGSPQRFYVADTGNDRVLFVDGGTVTTVLGPESGIRHPKSVRYVPSTKKLYVAFGKGILEIDGDPSVAGANTFSWSFVQDTVKAYDSVEFKFNGGTPPTAYGNYLMNGATPFASGSISIAGSTATLTAIGTPGNLPVGNVRMNVSGISPSALPGTYFAEISFKNAGVIVRNAALPHFIQGDDVLSTLQDNASALVSSGNQYPYGITSTWPAISFDASIPNFIDLPNNLVVTSSWTSNRYVENVSLTRSGKIATLKFEEFVRLDCISGNHIKRERILKFRTK